MHYPDPLAFNLFFHFVRIYKSPKGQTSLHQGYAKAGTQVCLRNEADTQVCPYKFSSLDSLYPLG